MKNTILLNLAKKWEKEAATPKPVPVPPAETKSDAHIRYARERSAESSVDETKKQCAELLRLVVELFGGPNG